MYDIFYLIGCEVFMFVIVEAFIGGTLIGLGGVILMLANGRIAGVSGIVGGVLSLFTKVEWWRWGFIIGLISAPLFTSLFGYALPSGLDVDVIIILIGGLLVGIGTNLGSGCTSGHGICGIGRLSKRSIIATIVFMFAAMCTVALTRHVF